MNVLVIATHPDDEVLGCGGAMARHTAEGDKLHVLVMTRGISDLFSTEQIEETRRELKAAHQILGVMSVRFLDFPAPKLDTVPEYQLADAICDVLRSLDVDLLYIPHRGDIHVDHGSVFRAAMVAARPKNRTLVRRILAYETLSETDWAPPFADAAFLPSVFIDIGDYIKKKLDAMACYKSQLKSFPHPRSLDTIKALARYRGGSVGLSAAEGFMLIREIIA